MSKANKAGREPVSNKKAAETTDLYDEGYDLNMFQVDKELAKVLHAQGLAFKWINATKYRRDGNFHRAGWKAYQHNTDSGRGVIDFNLGLNPEGYIVRGDMLLAVMPTTRYEKRRDRLREQASLQSSSHKNRASELREKIRESGLGAKVYEGYEANADGSDEE